MSDSNLLLTKISRLCQLNANQWRRPISQEIRLNISRHFKKYSQIEQDNPNLIWLYTLMLQNEVGIPRVEVVAGMKKRILMEKVLTELSWRIIANGNSNDFRVVLDSQDPGNTPKWQWKVLIYWLQILTGLRRGLPIPEPIQLLFLHDSLIVIPQNGEVNYHGAYMHIDTLLSIMEEAENRLAKGLFEQFVITDLTEVVTWLASDDIELDKNQRKQGWKYLSKTAAEWRVDFLTKESYQGVKWQSLLPQIQIYDWIIKPVNDAWSLHRLAFTQHHCGDRFIDGCLKGKERVFAIHYTLGKIVATLRLTLEDDTWVVGDLKGIANAEVPREICNLGYEIAHRYNEEKLRMDNACLSQI